MQIVLLDISVKERILSSIEGVWGVCGGVILDDCGNQRLGFTWFVALKLHCVCNRVVNVCREQR